MGAEDYLQQALDLLERVQMTVIDGRAASMYDQLGRIQEMTQLLMFVADECGLDVFTTLPYDL